LDAQAVLRMVLADRERRLEGSAVEVLTALGERDRAVQDAELRAGEALLRLTVDEGLSLREAADWCGGFVTVRELARLRRLARDPQDVASGKRTTSQRSRSGRAAPGSERRSVAT
jgi:hypothetical protein